MNEGLKFRDWIIDKFNGEKNIIGVLVEELKKMNPDYCKKDTFEISDIKAHIYTRCPGIIINAFDDLVSLYNYYWKGNH